MMDALKRQKYTKVIGISAALMLAFLGISQLVTWMIYEADGSTTRHEQEVDMDIDFVPNVYSYMKVSSEHEFEDFDRIEDGVRYFYSEAEGERCLMVDGNSMAYAEFEHKVRANVASEGVSVRWDAPERIYCLPTDGNVVPTILTLQGTVVNIRGDDVGREAPMTFRDSEIEECDGDDGVYFSGYEPTEDSEGWVTVDMWYSGILWCDGLLENGDMTTVLPDRTGYR